jgi:hypothetical protein
MGGFATIFRVSGEAMADDGDLENINPEILNGAE